MEEKTYDKWIRNKIPETIQETGLQCDFDIVSADIILNEYFPKKVQEELTEIINSKFDPEEFADLLEVIESAIQISGYTLSLVRNIQQQKAKDRGSFSNQMILKKVF